MAKSDCTCGRIAVGLVVTEVRNLNPECPQHGLKSAWFHSPEQKAKREAEEARTLELYSQVRASRAAARTGAARTGIQGGP